MKPIRKNETRLDPPFTATACSCVQDRANCKRQPGHLLPGQMEEILLFLKVQAREAGEAARRYFWNSPGMVLSKAGKLFRVRTITPQMKDGHCVFYQKRRCQIHPVAPFGCRFFDVHMDVAEGQRRSMWGVNRILENLADYEEIRDQLPEATSYRPNSAL